MDRVCSSAPPLPTAVGDWPAWESGGGPPGGPRRGSSYDVPMSCYGQGSVRAASGTTLGVLATSKMKENERFYGFTDFREPAAHRGRDSHATANQVTANQRAAQRDTPLSAYRHSARVWKLEVERAAGPPASWPARAQRAGPATCTSLYPPRLSEPGHETGHSSHHT